MASLLLMSGVSVQLAIVNDTIATPLPLDFSLVEQGGLRCLQGGPLLFIGLLLSFGGLLLSFGGLGFQPF